ncbi:hypothetical protein HDE68_000437 [Pedobacter cryoconitis]|uniref:Uncharacterized protein n=1 Tax=Pedobacter cryoconitis TaxID=188932 RepID=A0A7W9DWY7_9SPHI|nr:hypothetical protein [Pedobacter cryoconitis]MBB5634552.1 hypothetical protein [Pedobacter cryoconitis]
MIKSLVSEIERRGSKAIDSYPGFEYPVHLLRKFICAVDIFTILLQDGKIVHYRAADTNRFRSWLIAHQVEDIKPELIES